MLVIIVFVAFVYFGGSNVPKVLRDNKEMLLGVVVGIVLYSFFGMGLVMEGGPKGETDVAERERSWKESHIDTADEALHSEKMRVHARTLKSRQRRDARQFAYLHGLADSHYVKDDHSAVVLKDESGDSAPPPPPASPTAPSKSGSH